MTSSKITLKAYYTLFLAILYNVIVYNLMTALEKQITCKEPGLNIQLLALRASVCQCCSQQSYYNGPEFNDVRLRQIQTFRVEDTLRNTMHVTNLECIEWNLYGKCSTSMDSYIIENSRNSRRICLLPASFLMMSCLRNHTRISNCCCMIKG